MYKLDAHEVSKIKRLLMNGETQQSIADYYDVAHTTIHRIAKGFAWQEVKPAAKDHNESFRQATRNNNEQVKRLTPLLAAKAKRLLIEGYQQSEIAELYGVRQPTISQLKNKRIYKHVKPAMKSMRDNRLDYHGTPPDLYDERDFYIQDREPRKKRTTKANDGTYRAPITHADVAIIKRRLLNGDSGRSIAADYNTSVTAISFIKNGKTWQRVEPAEAV